MKSKIKNKNVRDKNYCKELFTEMNDDLENFKKICGEYDKGNHPSRKEKFSEIHKDLQKHYWSKYNVDILQRKNNAVFLQNNTSQENNHLNDSRK
jgi:hypothetical protein